MIDGKAVLAWIPARGGSKGIKDKNIKPLLGEPLIAYTIKAALSSKYVDRVMVSTDSPQIAEVAKAYGAWVPSLRPAELAADTSKTLDAVLYTVKTLETLGESFPVFCLLQPTSPLRKTADIDAALETYISCGCKSLVSVSPVETSPLLISSLSKEGYLEPILQQSSTCRRQDMPKYYRVNGAIYINRTQELCETTSFNDNKIPYIMINENSIDIDSIDDFNRAEAVLKRDINTL